MGLVPPFGWKDVETFEGNVACRGILRSFGATFARRFGLGPEEEREIELPLRIFQRISRLHFFICMRDAFCRGLTADTIKIVYKV